MAAAAQVQFIDNTLIRKSSSSAFATSTSSTECCALASSGHKKFCSPRGLAGNGLEKRSGRLSLSSRSRLNRVGNLTSTARSAAAAAPTRSIHEESLMMDIDSQGLEADTPSLVEQCSDLDWKTLVNDLRSEALSGLESAGLRALSLKALEKLMESWISDQMVDGIESPRVGNVTVEELGWSFEVAARDLHMQAKLQAAQALSEGVDSSFDWEIDVAELHQRILAQGGAEQLVLKPEHRLLQAWANTQGQVARATDQLTHEALASNATHMGDPDVHLLGHVESVATEPQVEVARSSLDSNSNGSARGKSFLALGAAVATGLVVEGSWMMDAVAGELSPEGVEAAARSPSWLVPAVLVFPPLSYFLFNVYRDKVNPYAKLTDWMFGVVAITIVSNIVMMAVWGVRLY